MDPTLFPFLEGGVGPGSVPPPFGGLGALLGSSAAGAPYMPPGSTAGSVGGNLANLPLPPPRPPGAPPGPFIGPPGPPMGLTPPGPGSVVPGSASPIYTPSGQQLPGQAQAKGLMDRVPGALQTAARGVQAPAAPQAQTVRTPNAPQMAPVGASAMINLLTSLGIGPQQALQMGLGRRFG